MYKLSKEITSEASRKRLHMVVQIQKTRQLNFFFFISSLPFKNKILQKKPICEQQPRYHAAM